MNEVTCPKCGAVFALGWRKVRSLRNEIQHHLYMSDSVEVIESHKIADKLVEGIQERVWKKQGVTR